MRAALLATALLLLAATPASAAPELVKVGDFNAPVHVASPPQDPRVFVVEQRGAIKIVGGGTFLDLTGETLYGSERGLLSMAFAPDYATSGRFYVFLTSRPDGHVEVREYQGTTLVRTLLDEAHSASNHNGGQLQFGPDGGLYVSIGDNASSGNAQNGSPYGKIHRIDVATGARTIWSSGLRNPWRFSFDRATGDLLIGDVGETSYEEINWSHGPNAGQGVNYGWPCNEGPNGPDSCGQRAAISRSHDDGYRAIIGGYVVRDPGLPTLIGRYLYGDAAISSLRSVALPDSGDRAEPLPISSLSSFGEDACGRLYAASLDGPVYRIQDGAATPCSFPAAPEQPVDATAPGLRVRILPARLKQRRLRFAVTCSEACRVAVRSRLRGLRRLGVRRRQVAASRRTIVPVRMTRKLTRRVRRTLNRRGFVRLAVTVRATDAAGNARVVTRRGRLTKR